MPGDPGVTVVTCSCAFLFCTRGCGCIERPAFPAPSEFSDALQIEQHSRGSRGEIAEVWVCATNSPSDRWSTCETHRLAARSSPAMEKNRVGVMGIAALHTSYGLLNGLFRSRRRRRGIRATSGPHLPGDVMYRAQNGLLKNREPFSPYRQGNSTALVMPIRMPLATSTLPRRA
jgi:hypothetical protein